MAFSMQPLASSTQVSISGGTRSKAREASAIVLIPCKIPYSYTAMRLATPLLISILLAMSISLMLSAEHHQLGGKQSALKESKPSEIACH